MVSNAYFIEGDEVYFEIDENTQSAPVSFILNVPQFPHSSSDRLVGLFWKIKEEHVADFNIRFSRPVSYWNFGFPETIEVRFYTSSDGTAGRSAYLTPIFVYKRV